MQPPVAADIDARYREAILNADTLVPPTEDETEFVSQLLERHSPEAIAAAYLRQQLAARPVPEDVTANAVLPPPGDKDPRKAERFQGGTWFKVTLGRKQRAEPRWVLPMLCKAGNVTKGAIGSIRIFDTETLFEVAADKADSFQRAVERNGTGERGVNILPVDAPGEAQLRQSRERPPAKRREDDAYDPAAAPFRERPARKPREGGYDPAAASAERPARKPRFGSGDLDAADFAPAAEAAAPAPKPRKPAKPVSKDKGKPKWSKPAAAPETRAPKKAKPKDHKKRRAAE